MIYRFEVPQLPYWLNGDNKERHGILRLQGPGLEHLGLNSYFSTHKLCDLSQGIYPSWTSWITFEDHWVKCLNICGEIKWIYGKNKFSVISASIIIAYLVVRMIKWDYLGNV